jgi:hypothetical protein
MKSLRLISLLLIVATAIAVSACGGSDSASTATDATATVTDTAAAATTDTGMITTGSATCDDATLLAAAQEADASVTKLAPGTKCADGWAVIFPVNADYEYTMVLQAEGQFWVPKKGVDCMTIPEVLQSLCETN